MAEQSSGSSTGLIDAVNGRPVRVHPASGTYYLPKAGWPHFWGRGLDALVVIVVAAIVMAVLN